jgi:large subunit ribosomal protein L18
VGVKERVEGRAKRHRRIRRVVRGSGERPRLVVFRSVKHIYAQVVDDERGVTVAAAGSLSPELKDSLRTGGNVVAAKAVGELIAKRPRPAGSERSCSTAVGTSTTAA